MTLPVVMAWLPEKFTYSWLSAFIHRRIFWANTMMLDWADRARLLSAFSKRGQLICTPKLWFDMNMQRLVAKQLQLWISNLTCKKTHPKFKPLFLGLGRKPIWHILRMVSSSRCRSSWWGCCHWWSPQPGEEPQQAALAVWWWEWRGCSASQVGQETARTPPRIWWQQIEIQ